MTGDSPGSPSRRLRPRDRLRSAEDYRRASRQGRREQGERFTVLVAPGVEGRARLGIAVPRQVGGAVLRNRLRRLIREYFRQNRALFAANEDVVVVPRPGVGWLRLSELAEIGTSLARARSRGRRRSA